MQTEPVHAQPIRGNVDWRQDRAAYQSHHLDRFNKSLPRLNRRFQAIPIDRTFLKTKLEEYSGAKSVVIEAKEVVIKERGTIQGRNLARAFLMQEYKALGFQTSLHPYRTLFGEGANVVAEKQGAVTDKVLILSAHLDSVGNPGADDDGSGIISNLAVAKALSKSKLKYTLRILAFDQEELGLVGSYAYVDELKKNNQLDQVVGAIQSDMVGYDDNKDGAMHIIDCNRKDSAFFTAAMLTAITDLKLPLKRSAACTDRSDHDAFWKANKPAIALSEDFFGGDANPCYHSKCDTVDKIDYDFMTNITQALASTAATLLEAQAPLRFQIPR